MQIDGINHIVGVESLAVMKDDPGTDFENPFGGSRLRLPALKQLRNRSAVRVDFDEAVHDLITDVDRHPVDEGSRVEAVGGGAARHPEPESTAAARYRVLRN